MEKVEGLSMIHDLLMMGLFWGLIMGPCLMAQRTGLHRDEVYRSR